MTFVEERGQEIYEAIEARRTDPAAPIKPIFEAYGKETSIDAGTVSSTYYAHRRKLREQEATPPPPPAAPPKAENRSGAGPLETAYYEAVRAKLDANPTMTQKDAITQTALEMGRTRPTVQSGFYRVKREREGPGTGVRRDPQTPSQSRDAQRSRARRAAKAGKVPAATKAVAVQPKTPKPSALAPLQGVPVDQNMSLGSLLRALADKVEADEAEHEALKQMMRGVKAQLEGF